MRPLPSFCLVCGEFGIPGIFLILSARYPYIGTKTLRHQFATHLGKVSFARQSNIDSREQKRHIELLHVKLFPVALVTGPPGRVSRQKDLCCLRSEDST